MSIILPPESISYDKAFEYLMEWEDSHPISGEITKDAGGFTKFGISSNAYPNVNMKALTLEQAKHIYLMDYWEINWTLTDDGYTQELANKHFQMKVNLGAGGYDRLLDCITYISKQAVFNFEMLCLAQLVHYKERHGSLNRIPTGLRKRALG
jgi:Glycosyl hydrolase 108